MAHKTLPRLRSLFLLTCFNLTILGSNTALSQDFDRCISEQRLLLKKMEQMIKSHDKTSDLFLKEIEAINGSSWEIAMGIEELTVLISEMESDFDRALELKVNILRSKDLILSLARDVDEKIHQLTAPKGIWIGTKFVPTLTLRQDPLPQAIERKRATCEFLELLIPQVTEADQSARSAYQSIFEIRKKAKTFAQSAKSSQEI